MLVCRRTAKSCFLVLPLGPGALGSELNLFKPRERCLGAWLAWLAWLSEELHRVTGWLRCGMSNTRGACVRGCDGDEISRGEGGGDRDVVAMLMLRGLVHKVSMSGPAVIPGVQCLTF